MTAGKTCALLAFIACAAATPARGAAIRVVDDRGVAVDLAAPARRIVTLSPHLTELAYAAGAGAHLVAVARYSDYPEAAQALPEIGDSTRVDLERVLALRPDLVLAWKSGNAAVDIARLERLGLTVYVSEATRLADVARAMRAIGELTGTDAPARERAAAVERDIAALRARHAARPPVRVFYQIWDRPLLTVNGGHLISDVLTLCGGVNVFAGARLLTPAVSLEALMAAQPQAILGGSSAFSPADFITQWRAVKLPALAALPVLYVPPDLIQRQTPRIVQGAAFICDRLEEVRAAR